MSGGSDKTPAIVERLEAFMNSVNAIGQGRSGGWTRLAFSLEEREAHSVFKAAAEKIGLVVWTDPIGNTYADVPVRKDGIPRVVIGSHLDTVPRGGAYDGVAGVAAALEVARLAVEAQDSDDIPLRVVAFAAEEGARFGASCIGSRLAARKIEGPELQRLRDAHGISAWQAAEAVGLRPDASEGVRWDPKDVSAFVELHVEQGRVLESRGRMFGLADSVAGSTRLEIIFDGRSDHSGATPMRLRKDALTAASEFVLQVERCARQRATSVATVGRLEVEPGSLTTVPGRVRLVVDVRDIDSARQRTLASSLLEEARRIGAGRAVKVSARLLADQSPVLLHRVIREQVAAAITSEGLSFCVVRSGANHDAAQIASVVPTALVFIPSRDGISHSPKEFSDVRQIARGVQVLFRGLQLQDVTHKARLPIASSREQIAGS